MPVNGLVIRKNGIPLYVQVKEKILADIRSQVFKAGDKLPTERELSEQLGVSRNTVSQAYRDLENGGVLTSMQGRGTFVCARDQTVKLTNRRDLLKKVINVALEESLQLGFSIDDFLALADACAKEKAVSLHKAQVAFLECNREQVEYFSRKLEFGGVHIRPVILDDLKDQDRDEWHYVETADLVVTTFFHLDEVQELLGQTREILAISLDPELETIVQIARVPSGFKTGLVCRSQNFAAKVKMALFEAGLDELNLQVSTSSDPDVLAAFIEFVDVVVVSPGRRREIETYCKQQHEIIDFVFKPDAASVNLLRAALADVRHG